MMFQSSKALRSTVFAGVLLLSPLASGQSLREAMVSTFQANPNIASSQATALQANEVYNQNVAQTKLSVSASIGVQNSRDLSGGGGSNSGSVSITAQQQLMQGGPDGIPAGVRASLGQVALANANYKSQEAGVFSQVVSAYMGFLREQASIGVSHSGLVNARKEVENARVRMQAGEGTSSDVALAQASLAQAEANHALAHSALQTAAATFRQVVTRNPSNLRDPGFPALPHSLDAALAQGLSQHPLIKAAEINMEIARDTIVTTRAQYGMSLNGSLTASQPFAETGGSWNQVGNGDATLGFNLSIPLYDSGLKQAAIRSAELGLANAEANLANQTSGVRFQITSAWGNTQAQLEQLNALIALASAREVVLRATEAEFDAGTATMLQVLTAQQNYADAQSQYVRSKAGAVIAAYNLISAIGGMTTEQLGLPVQHFNSVDRLEDNRNLTYPELIARYF